MAAQSMVVRELKETPPAPVVQVTILFIYYIFHFSSFFMILNSRWFRFLGEEFMVIGL